MTDAFLSDPASVATLTEDAAVEDVYVFPLSFAQQRLWFFQQMYPESPAYNMPVALRLRGELEVGPLHAALNEVFRRHEVLRTIIDLIDGQPAQIISPALTVSLPVVDLSDLPATEREAEARRWASAEVVQAFDLRRGPLCRIKLLRVSREDHVLMMVLHHIISDGWSIDLLMQEVARLYAAYAAGQNSPLPDLPIQYADYALWQREWLQGAVLDRQLTYWREQLSGAPPVLTLPTDRPRPEVQTLNGAHIEFVIPVSLTLRLRRLCQREGMTLFMPLLAAFQLLLARYSGQTDVSVGTPIAGRNRQEVENLIGFFVNTLVLRTDLSGNPAFRELLRRVREVCLGAYAHAELPLERLVEELQPERSLSHAPLFQVLFVLQNTPDDGVFCLPGLEVSVAELETAPTTAFDLTLNLEEIEDNLCGRFRYNTDLFEAETMRRMAEHYLTLLESSVEDLDRPILELPLMRVWERQRVLEEWNETKHELAPDTCAHELFERQVEQVPDQIALAFDGQQLSYAELNRRSNQLAHHLRSLGIRPDQTVAICVSRSLEMVIGLLGVLKAGAAYVPLDPASPGERLSFMLEETEAAILLTERRLVPVMPATQSRVICLDADWPIISESKDHNPAPVIERANLAYVIYTSGSTGMPKGVMVSHGNLLNAILAQLTSFQEPISSTLLLMSYFFDGSLFSIFCALCQGGMLVIPREGQQADPAHIARLIAENRIPHIFTVPSFYSLLLEQAEPEQLESLRIVHVGAENCSSQLFSRHRQMIPQAILFNEYGPTETTIWCTQYFCGLPATNNAMPIGRPVRNAEIYLLDDYLQPVPIGIPGQVYVGGLGVARGYLKSPSLTAEVFIPHPYSREPGARLYRTGDVARYQADGNIVFLGRIDQQVKLRGYRIELGEVEVKLGECPRVQQAVVTVREDTPGDRHLVAYVVTADGERPTTQELRESLKNRLPEYMIPSAFIFLDKLPLTRTGKLDRQALPSPDGTRPRLAEEYVAPRTKLELLLAETWQEMLGVQRIGLHDNFFDLGGDSMRAALLINKLQEQLGDYIYVVALFEAPTIASLAAYLKKNYFDAVSKVLGDEELEAKAAGGESSEPASLINVEAVAAVRELIGAAPLQTPPTAKNPSAVFILSPPRSGSTLLRVMLAGHPSLFAPPELELLSFNNLAERRGALTGKYSFWLEGTIRALMEIKSCGMEEARQIMDECEEQNLSVPQFYGLLQAWIGDRRLVDKTPSYALDKDVLKRAENCFDDALYVHLLRHPFGMIRSFEEAKLEQVFFRYQHSFSRRELAELIWVISQQNILEFLEQVPAGRQFQLRFEELVRSPREVLEGVCGFLGLDFQPEMVEPYQHQENRMTDGIHPLSRMLGDVKFHQHSEIDAAVAERWKGQTANDSLSQLTWEVAEALGYPRERAARSVGMKSDSGSPAGGMQDNEITTTADKGMPSVIVPIQPQGSRPPFFCVHPVGGGVFCYRALARHLGSDQPFYGLQARDLIRGQEPHADVETMAADYLKALRSVQPTGPYRLGGWSLGGVTAFEMAQQLRRQGQSVALLTLIDSVVPSLMDQSLARSDESTQPENGADPSRNYDVLAMLEELCSTGTEEEIQDAFEQVKREGFLPTEVAPQDFQRWLRGCHARVQAVRAYDPSPFAGRIVLFKTIESDEEHKLTTLVEKNSDSAFGWSELAAEGVEVYTVAGSHQTVVLEPHVADLGNQLKRFLA
jgi:amino acid adenylation domain-containing protein